MKFTIEKNFFANDNIDERLFYASLIDELEEIVEKELLKDVSEMNVELIDDCCVAIENIRSVINSGKEDDYVMFSDIEKIIKRHNKKTRCFWIVSVACAAIMVLCLASSFELINQSAQGSLKANSSLNEALNVLTETTNEIQIAEVQSTKLHINEPEFSGNDKTTSSHIDEPTISQEVDNTVSETNDTTTISNNEPTTNTINGTTVATLTTGNNTGEITSPQITQPVPMIYKLVTIVPPGFRNSFADVSQIDLSNVFVKVFYSDNSVKVVSIDECGVSIGSPDKNGKTRITITYQNMYTSIYVTIGSDVE